MGFWTDAAKFFDPGDVFGIREGERTANANNALDAAQVQQQKASQANQSLYNQYNNRVNATYSDAASKYDTYLKNLEGTNFTDPGKFEDNYNKTVEDFYDKYYNQRVAAVKQNMENTAANAGGLFSSDFLDKSNAKAAAMATEAWDNALDKYNQDRSRALNEFSTNANIQNTVYQNQYNKNKDLLGQAQNAQDNIMNAYGSYISNMAGQNNADATMAANIASAKASNENAGNRGLISRIFG